MIRKVFWFITATLLVYGPHAEAQQQSKIPKIGFLTAGSVSGPIGVGLHVSLKRELQKLGYIDGKNVTFIYRHADNKYEQLPALAEELVRLRVDVIITPGANDTQAAKNATKTIPIVAVLWDSQNTGSAQIWEESQPRAKELGLQFHSFKINSAEKLESGFKEAVKAGSGALDVTSGAVIASIRTQIISIAAKSRLPAIYLRANWIAEGGLMSYRPDEVEPYQRVAY